MNIIITGANRGIGLELTRVFRARGHHVLGTARDTSPDRIAALGATGAEIETLDVGDDASVADFARRLARRAPPFPVDVLVNNAGVGTWSSLDDVTTDELTRVYNINALGPLRVTRALLPALVESRARVFHITSKMGSIGDVPSGGAYAYRMSKAALNMCSANLAADLKGRGVASIVLHPGWVRTEMGGRNAPLAVEDSARELAFVIERTGLEATGQFLSFNGRPIPW